MIKIETLNNDWDYLYNPKTKELKISYRNEDHIYKSTITGVECENLVLAMMMANDYCINTGDIDTSFSLLIEDPGRYDGSNPCGEYNYSDEFLNASFEKKLEDAKKEFLRFDDPQEDEDLPF